MNHFGIAIGAIAATVIGGAVVLDQMTKADKPAESARIEQPKGSPQTQVASTTPAAESAAVVAETRPVEPAPVRKMASAAPEVSAQPAKPRAAPVSSAPKAAPAPRAEPAAPTPAPESASPSVAASPSTPPATASTIGAAEQPAASVSDSASSSERPSPTTANTVQ